MLERGIALPNLLEVWEARGDAVTQIAQPYAFRAPKRKIFQGLENKESFLYFGCDISGAWTLNGVQCFQACNHRQGGLAG